MSRLFRHGAPKTTASGYWCSRWLFERALALVYFVAFLVAVNQFVPLLGEHGLLPVPAWVRAGAVPRLAQPLLPVSHRRRLPRRGVARPRALGSGVDGPDRPRRQRGDGCACGRSCGCSTSPSSTSARRSTASAGKHFFSRRGSSRFFSAGARRNRAIVITWLLRWLLFRLMFGAGLIKLRGDPCWLELTCLDYYFETQPMPNPLTLVLPLAARVRPPRPAWWSITSSSSPSRSSTSRRSRWRRSPASSRSHFNSF